MSVINGKGEICFFCREPITGVGIEWEEQNNWAENPIGEGLAKIHLHPKCSTSLGLRLIRDGLDMVADKEEKENIKRILKTNLKMALDR